MQLQYGMWNGNMALVLMVLMVLMVLVSELDYATPIAPRTSINHDVCILCLFVDDSNYKDMLYTALYIGS